MSNDVTFYDNFVPRLKAGEYTVQVSQSFTPAAGSDMPDAPQVPTTQKFIVRGPRFQIDPADVHRVFPPAGGTGFYDEYMPMIVLNKRALPWERELKLTPANSRCPWLALLVFSETDLPAQGTPGSLNNPTRTISVPLSQVIKTPDGTLGPTLDIAEDEDPAKIVCNVIDVPAAVFVGLMPVASDLPLLAHVRQVSTVAKEPQNAKHDGWYSSVIANRFAVPPPKTGNASQMGNIVHLVSLEGYESYIQSNGTVKAPTEQKVRLISLYSWSFTCLRDPAENFAALTLNLIAQINGERPDLLLRLPLDSKTAAPTERAALSGYTRLRNGYTPMSYASQTGEQSFAWYRGPLAPIVAQEFLAPESGTKDNPLTPTNTSEAMIFDPVTGVFDLSYSVAFQTGRSLALNSLPFSTALLQWRRDSHAAVDRLAERLRLNIVHVLTKGFLKAGGGVADMGVTDLAALLDDRLVSNAFKDYLANDFHQEVAMHVGRTGSFSAVDTKGLLKKEAPSRRPVTPRDLMDLTLHPPVTSLLQHLNGLTNFGTVAADVSPGTNTLKLNAPLTESIGAGAQLVLESPDGEEVPVRVAAPVGAGDVEVAIASSNSETAPPAGSVLRLAGADDSTANLLVDWLARAVLLYGVPFNNLVPDERMLPLESIRFFYLDTNWIDALLDGALSVGTQSSRDGLFNDIMRDAIHRAVTTTVTQVRGKLLNQATASASASEMGTLAGFVMRSAVVSGWQGLEVHAYSSADQEDAMKPLRLDRVAPDVMIGIYPKVPQRLEFDEPSEGLVFGTEDEGIELRYLPGATGATAANLGHLIEPKVTLKRADFPWRKSPGATDTLQIGGDDGMAKKLWTLSKAPPPTLSPAAFAVQMVRVPEQMLFLPQKGGPQ